MRRLAPRQRKKGKKSRENYLGASRKRKAQTKGFPKKHKAKEISLRGGKENKGSSQNEISVKNSTSQRRRQVGKAHWPDSTKGKGNPGGTDASLEEGRWIQANRSRRCSQAAEKVARPKWLDERKTPGRKKRKS